MDGAGDAGGAVYPEVRVAHSAPGARVWSTGHAHATPVYRYRVGLLLDIHQKRGVVHAERAGDVAFEVLVQRQPTSRLDDLAQPVGIAAVDKRRAGIGQERALEKALLRNRRGMSDRVIDTQRRKSAFQNG